MRKNLALLAVIFLVGGVLLSPLRTYALGTSFGGKITTIIPCISALGPSLFVSIIPAGVFQTNYIWTPATLTYSAGPPTHPGQQILGVADTPFTCFIPSPFPFIPPIPLVGQRMQFIGTSAI